MGITVSITVSKDTYLRNPLDTELGRNIIKHSIALISEKGFHCFNFKQLACRMKSTEASVYRYFENKHMLLVYLTSWYWEYLDYLIKINIRNVDSPYKKLRILIRTIVNGATDVKSVDCVDIKMLHKIIVEHSTKVTHMKKVVDCQKEGLFTNYKNLNNSISEVILECDKEFKYPTALASNILKMALDHTYYAEHFCTLTEITNCMVTKKNQLEEMLVYFVERLLKVEKPSLVSQQSA